MKKITEYFCGHTRALFLTDACGAFITACFLGVVWRNYLDYTGMPKAVLSGLSLLALLLSAYSLSCFLFFTYRRPIFIRIIAAANLLYGSLSLAFLVVYFPRLTTIGRAYFLSELLIISGLAYLEFRVAVKSRKS